MKIALAVNTGFAVNRFTPPEQWIPFVREELDINCVQLTADMLMPYMLDPLAMRIAERTRRIADDHGLTVHSTFTGAFTRLNHFGHPDREVREYWLRWFKAFADVSVALGARSMGSHFGIQTIPDCSAPARHRGVFDDNVDCWRRLADHGHKAGLEYLTWEPMSIPREYGGTIRETEDIQAALADFAIPMRLCLDVDHGDIDSADARDNDPYAWIEHFAAITPIIHLKQSHDDKGGHWPFTTEHNRRGKITPERVVQAFEAGGATDVCFILEISFRERGPAERRMGDDLKQSVAYWRPHCLC